MTLNISVDHPLYGIVGNGNVATHFLSYLNQLNVSFIHWYRDSGSDTDTDTDADTDLESVFSQVKIVVLLISDDAIENFILDNPSLKNKILIHFSGSLVTEYAFGMHPLMTFSGEVRSISFYRSIPFIIDDNAPQFCDVFPMFANPSFRLKRELKARYHAFCVLTGNFTTLLWQSFFKEASNLSLPQEAMFPYLQTTFENLLSHPDSALTGPIARNDIGTIEKNLNALKETKYHSIYQAFVNEFAKERNLQ